MASNAAAKTVRRTGAGSEPDRREIHGQLTGYLFRNRDSIPPVRPPYDPTGAILPKTPEAAATNALVLVNLDGYWFPLSEAAVDTYAHTRAVWEGERYYLAVPGRSSDPWFSALFELTASGSPLAAARVRAAYGEVAARRARSDWKTLQIRARRIA